MSENKIVYVVTSGSYEDRDVEGVFDDKEVADKYATGLDDGEVSEFILNSKSAVVSAGIREYNVVLDRDGSIYSVKSNWADKVDVTSAQVVMRRRGGGVTVCGILARSEEEARSVALDTEKEFREKDLESRFKQEWL